MQFISQYKEHRIVITPDTHKIVGINRVFVKGQDVQFHKNLFETKDKKVIDFLLECDDMKKGIIHKVPSKKDILEEKKRLLKKLQEEVSEKKEEKEEGFICDICGKEFKSEIGLKSHKRKAHK